LKIVTGVTMAVKLYVTMVYVWLYDDDS